MSKTIKIEIETIILDWLLEIIPPSKDELYEKLHKWRSGDLKPTWAGIKKASNKFHIPLGYFFLKEPPIEKFEVLEYRTVASSEVKTPSRDLTDTLSRMQQIQQWMREVRIDDGMLPLSFVGEGREIIEVSSHADMIVPSAKKIAEHLGLSHSWNARIDSRKQFLVLRKQLSHVGILVFQDGTVNGNPHRSLDLHEFRAFTLIDEYAPLIFINNKDKGYGKVFSLLHEVVHIWVGQSSFFNNDSLSTGNKLEQFCNAVTAEILLPVESFTQAWGSLSKETPTENKIEFLSKDLRCSANVILRRALDQGYITQEFYNSFSKKLLENIPQGGGSGGTYWNRIRSNLDHQFMQSLTYGTQSGKISYTEAYRLSTLNRINFDKFFMQNT
ncbi:ImmA/IrrE family metallo-endopeptidase [Entomospira entomophila]|uniref:ImmA/IrrE family metallo-endopeptidase n=1 Tax=Entomospira entomophila TaxID=2719988 RepID=A0A968GDC9_9SPIO|nr:ImmA/IrrE family metallo-endopeptidase [Entomospira entomophilus]NIZ40929.1 ImmA/IrrE family metallo-endopeptidase [Entomospira entomophilus]WDI35142.1 ImmA/IrrE family metallo-endopeptidase [Entomospira entomophilus]